MDGRVVAVTICSEEYWKCSLLSESHAVLCLWEGVCSLPGSKQCEFFLQLQWLQQSKLSTA